MYDIVKMTKRKISEYCEEITYLAKLYNKAVIPESKREYDKIIQLIVKYSPYNSNVKINMLEKFLKLTGREGF